MWSYGCCGQKDGASATEPVDSDLILGQSIQRL